MKSAATIVRTMLIATPLLLQAASVDIARWQGDATAAVSLISDDYGQHFWGDVKKVETICDRTGVKMTFATNTHGNNARAVEIYDCWNAARRLQKKGHEFHSHSANHNGKDWAGDELKLQVLDSQAKIESELPGSPSLMFFFPNKSGDSNGQANEEAFIREQRFIGVRPNVKSPIAGFPGSTPGDVPEPFKISTTFYQEKHGPDLILKKVMPNAIKHGAWATPTFHNIGKRGGWGGCSEANFEIIAEGLKKQIDSGEVWSAGAQAVLMYALERESFTAKIAKRSKGYEVTFKKTVDKIAASPKVSDVVFTQPLTLIVSLSKTPTSIKQDGQSLPFVERSGRYLIDAKPQGGPVTIK